MGVRVGRLAGNVLDLLATGVRREQLFRCGVHGRSGIEARGALRRSGHRGGSGPQFRARRKAPRSGSWKKDGDQRRDVENHQWPGHSNQESRLLVADELLGPASVELREGGASLRNGGEVSEEAVAAADASHPLQPLDADLLATVTGQAVQAIAEGEVEDFDASSTTPCGTVGAPEHP